MNFKLSLHYFIYVKKNKDMKRKQHSTNNYTLHMRIKCFNNTGVGINLNFVNRY